METYKTYPQHTDFFNAFSLTWAQVSFSDHISVRPSVNFSHFHLLLHNPQANFNQTWQKHLWIKGIQVFFFKWSATPFFKGNNYEIANIHRQNFKNFFYRTTRLISIEFGTQHSLMIFKWRAKPFSKGRTLRNSENIQRRNSSIFFSRTTWSISFKLGTKQIWAKGI